MCNSETVEYLKQYRDNEWEIERLANEIVRWDNAAQKVTASIGNEIRSPSGDSVLQRSVEEIDLLKRDLIMKQSRAITLRREIDAAIGTAFPDRMRLILRYKYIDGLTYEKIAAKMGKTSRHIQSLHEIAVNRVSI